MGLLLIARDNIKKKKGNTFILFLLISLAVLFMYLGISVLSNMNRVIDDRNTAVNGADYLLFTLNTHTEAIENILKQQMDITYLEREKAIYSSGVKFYNSKNSAEKADQLDFIFLNKDSDRNLSVINLINQGNEWKNDSIILPFYMNVGMGYNTGDILKLMYKEQVYSFEIYGFTEDVMFSTPTNISVEKCFISSEYFNIISNEWGDTGVIYHADLVNNSNGEKFDENMNQILREKIPDFQYLPNLSSDYDSMKYGTSITANIFMGVLTVFAVLLIFISLVIVHFNINNSIEMNMQNIGMLEASGYTSGQLITATILEFMIIGIFGGGFGLLGANCASGILGGIVSASIGLFWKMNFDILSACLSILITLLLVLFAVVTCSLKFKRINPLDALRGGINAHNFKKNQIPLNRIPLPLNIAIGLKIILYNKKRNLLVCLIIIILTFCANESVFIYQNFALHRDKLLEITGLEMPDIAVFLEDTDINTLQTKMEELKKKAASVNGVEQIIKYKPKDIVCSNGENKITVNFDIYDKTDSLRVDTVYEGRRPKFDNEIMLTTTMAGKLKVSVGNVVYLEVNGERKDYLLVGISQGVNNLGKKAMITSEGMSRLSPSIIPSILYIYTEDSANLPFVIKNLKEALSGENVTIKNFQDYISVSLRSIVTVMKALCSVMLSVVLLVIALILVLLIKIQLIRERKQLGIYKALGYTTGQLIMQIVMSYIPIVFIGTIFGCIIAWFGVNPSFALSLTMFGIKRCNMDINITYMFVIIAGIVAWATLIAVISSYRIKRIVPWRMVQEL